MLQRRVNLLFILFHHQYYGLSMTKCKIQAILYLPTCSRKANLRFCKDDKYYCCEICSKSFTNMSNLERHKKTLKVHSEVESYNNKVCSKQFKLNSKSKEHKRNGHLRRQMKVHTVETSDKCIHLGKSPF